MWMRANVDPLPWCQLGRPHVIEEDEGPDEPPCARGKQPPHGEAAEISLPRFDDRLDGGSRCTVRADGVIGLGPAHNASSKRAPVMLALMRAPMFWYEKRV
jgi:hypothetical protein